VDVHAHAGTLTFGFHDSSSRHVGCKSASTMREHRERLETDLIPQQQLADLVELSRQVVPTARGSSPRLDLDALAEESIAIPYERARVVEREAVSQIMTILVTCFITCGACLMICMLLLG